MVNHKEIFGRFTRQKRNSIFTRKAMKKELIIPNGATKTSEDEMDYINGGSIEVKQYGFLGLGVKVIIKGTIAELALYISIGFGIVAFVTGLLMLILAIGQIKALTWIEKAAGAISLISSLVSITSWAKNTKYNFEFNL